MGKREWKAASVIVCICLLQTLFLSGCTLSQPSASSLTGSPSASIPVPTSISFSHYFSGAYAGSVQQTVDMFNQSQSNWQLKAVPLDHEAFKQSYLSDMRSKTPPELYSCWAGARTQAVTDSLQPIDELWKADNLDSVFPAELANAASTYDGHHYLLPITRHFVVMFYNRSVFNTLGLSEPHTWEEFMSVCETIRKAGITPISLGAKNRWPAEFWFDYLLLRTAGPDYRQRFLDGKAAYTDPEMKKVFGILSTLIRDGCFTRDATEQDWFEQPLTDFVGGRSAMLLMGSWAIGVLSEAPFRLTADKEYGYFVFPEVTPGIPTISLGPVDGLVIPKAAAYSQGGLDYLSFMAGEAAQKVISAGSGAISPSTRVPSSFYSQMQQRMIADIEAGNGWAFNFDLSSPPAEAEIGLDLLKEFWVFPDVYSHLLDEAQKKVLLLRRDNGTGSN